MVNVTEFMLNNGPVAFDKILRAPKPPKTSALGSSGLTRAEQFGDLISVDKTSARIGKFTGLTATILSVGASIKGDNRTKAIMRSLGCVGLTLIYMASAEK